MSDSCYHTHTKARTGVYSNMRQSFVATSTVTHFIPPIHTVTRVSQIHRKEKDGESIWRKKQQPNNVEWTGQAEIRKKEIPGSGRNVYDVGVVCIFCPTPGFKGRTLDSSGFSTQRT